MAPTQPRVALIGVGLVGTALAERLLDAGHDVVTFDRDASRCAFVAARGARTARSAVDAVRDMPWVLLSLPDTPALESVVAEIEPALAAHTIVLDTGTNDPQVIEALAHRLARAHVILLDAPLSGSSEQIRSGMGVAMGGGDAVAWAASRPVLEVIARQAFHLGGAGSGSRAKLATNLLLGLNRAALAEALVFAEGLGLDAAAFIELVRASPAYSRAVDAKGAKMLARDYTPESRIRQHRKDIALMLQAAKAAGVGLPLTNTHAELLDAAIAAGDGELDNAAVIEAIRRWHCRTRSDP